MRRSWPLLINVGAKSTHQHDCCNIYYNKRWLQVDTPRSRPLLINVYVNIQTTNRRYSQQWCGLEDKFCSCQLCIKSEVCCGTVGRCGNGWNLEAATGCWRPGEDRNMTENALSIIIIFSVQLQQTEISERKLFSFHYGGSGKDLHVGHLLNNWVMLIFF